jgi:arabinogalactan endo-1,4-beta-galactosidase
MDTNTAYPCITYLELSNVAEDEGDTLRYSAINYRIKIWASPRDNVNEEIY